MFRPKCWKEQVGNPAFCLNCGERLRLPEHEIRPSAKVVFCYLVTRTDRMCGYPKRTNNRKLFLTGNFPERAVIYLQLHRPKEHWFIRPQLKCDIVMLNARYCNNLLEEVIMGILSARDAFSEALKRSSEGI